MKVDNVKYIHEESVHNLRAPKEIVPVICKLLAPESVVDIGCGIGTFLHYFKKYHVKDVLGVDGNWVNKELLFQNIAPEEFKEQDLEKIVTLPRYFDLVVSIEVAEHISPESADIFIQNLVRAGKVILFSAAVPLQGGQNHINEQWVDYWAEKFLKHDYIVHDVLKPFFWNNPDIFFWYKQNMVLVAHKDYILPQGLEGNKLKNCIHEEMFKFRVEGLQHEIDLFREGKLPFTTYVKYLMKSLFAKK